MTQDWTAEDMRAALRRRHSATQAMGSRTVPGPWTCIEELLGCDLIALAAVQRPANGSRGGKYPRVGYEIKVSRSDLRHELLRPDKREQARDYCHEFYIATPKGLLTKDEIAWEQPDWTPEDFQRQPCAERCYRNGRGQGTVRFTPEEGYVPCKTCEGRGWLEKSLAERTAPTLWVPPDVGLVEVTRAGCRVVKPSPIRQEPTLVDQEMVGVMARFISAHPDPRHVGLVEADRALSKRIRDRYRQAA